MGERFMNTVKAKAFVVLMMSMIGVGLVACETTPNPTPTALLISEPSYTPTLALTATDTPSPSTLHPTVTRIPSSPTVTPSPEPTVPPPTATPTPTPLPDRLALEALYSSAGGENWINNQNWLSAQPISAWYGVRTNQTGSVVELNLEENGLRGIIPPELENLQYLEILNLNDNLLTGPIPLNWGTCPT